ncbi:MAG: DUF2779 domain-containing protein [Geobacteraceae bacterium]|nr:DUF2779 domain-containing protein [Geobacteraceae bacterium]
MTKKTTPIKMSKSRYTRGLTCLKSLWLVTHHPELREEYDAATQACFRTGHEVGEVAHQLFPGGTLIPYENMSYEDQINMTQEAMKTSKVIYEAAFRFDDVFIKADILRKSRQGWELYEVKSSNDAKDYYQHDVDVQYYVIDGSGIKISKAFIVHLNKEYVRESDLDIDELFVAKNVTKVTLERQGQVKKEIARMKRSLRSKEPKIDIGPQCDNPYKCDFKGHCWQHIPDNSVFDLAGNGVKKFDLYEKGIVKLEDVPLDILKGKQRQQAEAALDKKVIVDRKKIREFLDSLHYPLCYLDFETFTSAIPLYDGLRPYQQVPFQYSLHFQKKKGGKLHHAEFLAQPGVDPRKELLNQLLDDIPENACILAYNKSFEIDKLKKLAESFPRKKKKIQNIIDNMVDLIEPFRQRSIYSWKQQGSHSIKKVLPAFVPGMSYEGMEIGDGGEAMEAYHEMCALANKPRKLATLRKALLEYCKQDTLAMVKLLEVITQKARRKII